MSSPKTVAADHCPRELERIRTVAGSARSVFDPWRALSVASSLDGLWDWDLESNSLRYSDRCSALLGYGTDEVPNTMAFLWDSLHEEDAEAVKRALRRCLEADEPTDVECRLRAKDGQYRFFRIRGLAHRDAAGRAIAVVGLLQDITGLREKENQFRTLCDCSLAGIYIAQDERLQYANPAFAAILGITPDKLVGKPYFTFVHADDRARVEQIVRGRLDGAEETSQYEARLVRGDGAVVDVEILGSRIEYGGAPALIGTVLDITDRKRTDSLASDRLRFERLLADLSARFVNVPSEQLDEEIQHGLQALVEFLQNDRSTVVDLTQSRDHAVVTHAYAVPGFTSFPLGPVADDTLPWYFGHLRRGQLVFVRSIPEELPPEAERERAYCAANEIRSNVAIPLQAGGKILGALTFAFVCRQCGWPEEIIDRLQIVGKVFASAVLRRRSEESLRTALAENETLRARLEQENLYLREQAVLKHHHGRIIGQSDALKKVLASAERVAVTDAPVLLLGETGTGKELLAQTIHEISARKGRPMVVLNCASLPATLIESELFGREAGAYTGAASAQAGRFMIADGSTLFLDEIGEFPIELQAKLLRVLQDGRFERLGSPETITVDVRIIAATNRDLEQAMREGKFRADLYHRLNVFPIVVPPLRERPEDIPSLVWAFVESFGRRMGKTIKSIPRRTMDQLQRYTWPGNVRELSNIIERGMILTTGHTLRVELPSVSPVTAAPEMTLEECERSHILRVLHQTAWRIRGPHGAANILALKPTTLEARMARLGINRQR